MLQAQFDKLTINDKEKLKFVLDANWNIAVRVLWTGGGWWGATTFVWLTDTPPDYALSANKSVRVNALWTWLEYWFTLWSDVPANALFLTAQERLDIASNKTHTTNNTNPHNVTKTQVGLWNVDNTTDISKPISTLTQNALNWKAPTVHTHTKAEVWLPNVDNTADLAKPISTATQTALNAKEDNVNKKTTMTGNIASDVFFLSAKAIYTWATWLFATITQLNWKENSFTKNTWFNKNFWTTAWTVSEWNHTHTWFEASLWNPTTDWYILSSTALWARTWIVPPTWWGWTGLTLYDWSISWPQVVWDVFEVPAAWAWTINAFKISLWTLPVWANFIVTLAKNWVVISTATILTSTAVTNWLYVITNALTNAFLENDRLTVSITSVWTTVPWNNFTFSIS